MNSTTRPLINWLEGGHPLPLLALSIFLGVMFFLPSGVIDLRQQVSIFPLYGIGALLCYMICPVNRAVSAFVLFVGALTLARFTPDSYAIFGFIVCYATLYLMASTIGQRGREVIYNSLCVFALLNVLWVVLQAFDIFWIIYPIKGQAGLNTGFFSNSNETGVFLAAMLPLFFRPRWKWFIPIVLIGLVLTKSFTGFLCAGAVAVILMAFWKPKAAVAMAGVVATLGASFVMFVHVPAVNERLDAWSAATELILEKPIAGWGIGEPQYIMQLYFNPKLLPPEKTYRIHERVIFKDDLKSVYLKNQNPEREKRVRHPWTKLHNDYLQGFMEIGYFGMLIFGWVILSHIRAFSKTGYRNWMDFAVFLVLILSAFSFFTFQIGRLVFITVLFAGLIHGQRISETPFSSPLTRLGGGCPSFPPPSLNPGVKP